MITIWNFFKSQGFTDEGTAGIMGNLYAESHLNPKNLQDSYNNKIGLTDIQYTKQVDNGAYTNFISDEAGYGLAQWTFADRKSALLNYVQKQNKSIGDLDAQLNFLMIELKQNYLRLLNLLQTTSSVKEASDAFMTQFEKPKDQSESAKDKRCSYGLNYYNKFKRGAGKMKYTKTNPPMSCIMTNSTCYKGTSTMQIRGILWHSTGANNPYLKRYVQPLENDTNYNFLIAQIGKNAYGNDWNHETVQAGVNAWIGKLADESVTSIQTLPWNYKPWGCASGSKGSCNNGWIQFEICEDGLNDIAYFNKIYKEACELTAYLCVTYNLNPSGSIYFSGVNVPNILCHQDSYQLKLGSNHSDIYHWFNKYNKTMEDVRKDVAALMGNIQISSSGTASVIVPTVSVNCLGKGDVGDAVKALQENLIKLGYSCGNAGADGDFGNDTEKAVIKFQKANNLDPDGLVGEQTQNAIKAALKDSGVKISDAKNIYRVRKSWNDAKSQVGAYGILKNAQLACNKAGSGYSVFDSTGSVVYSATTDRVENTSSTIYSDVMIGHAAKDENGAYRGGQAGDQNGKEVYIRTWYRGSWNLVLRPNTSELAEKIAKAMEDACSNDNIGYDQNGRNSIYAEAKKVNLDLSKITNPCECDCSSLVSMCCITAGLPESIFYSGGNMRTTYNLRKACEQTKQFTIFDTSKYYGQKDYLKRGDILLYEDGHTAIVLADGNEAQTTVKEEQFLVRITANVLNVRKGPGASYSVTTTVKKGQVFTIVDQEGGYGKLKSGAGWIDLAYTTKI